MINLYPSFGNWYRLVLCLDSTRHDKHRAKTITFSEAKIEINYETTDNMKNKSKGKRLEYAVRNLFRKFVDPNAECQVMSGGAPGGMLKGDIRFSKKLPYNLTIECKNQERYNFWEWWSQTTSQATDFETPILIFTKNHKDTIAALKLEDFMKIYEELYDLLQQQELEEIKPCNHSKNVWKIRNIKKLAQEFLKDL